MKRIETSDLAALSREAAVSQRLRANRNLHEALDEPVQRMLNAFEPGTYVRPHRHAEPPKWELFLALSGAAACLTFDDDGTVAQRCEIRAGGPLYGVEIPAHTWHTVVALEAGTVLFELKEGPFEPLSGKDFPSWAPEAGTTAAAEWERRLRSAQPGHHPTAAT